MDTTTYKGRRGAARLGDDRRQKGFTHARAPPQDTALGGAPGEGAGLLSKRGGIIGIRYTRQLYGVIGVTFTVLCARVCRMVC